MQKGLWALFFAMILALGLHAEEFNKMATGEPELIQKGDVKAYCPVCGMSLKMFYKTSHGVILKDGTMKQYCSMRCLAADWPSIESHVKKIVVTDVKSEKLIDVKSAFYVVGSKVPGTMSMVSKLAFSNEADAKTFAAENGGDVMGFDAAFAKTKAALADDVDAFMKKKQKGMYPMGEKIYTAKCPKDTISLHEFNTIAELKVNLKNTHVCGELNEQELQAVSLYLWEIVRLEAHDHDHTTTIHVEKDEKCLVCGMFAYKYPKWAVRMNYDENGKPVSHVFDGVKDMMKFYINPPKWGNYTKHKDSELTILVGDYYTGEAMNGMKAFYVVGSDVMGPMGKEFVPFKTFKSAQTFMKDHKGLQIVEFSKIDEALIDAQEK